MKTTPTSMAASSSRKRTLSQRSKALEIPEKDETEKQLKLVLKPSNARQAETSVSVLRGCIEVPEEGEVVEGLLLTSQLMVPEEWGEIQELIKQLWHKYESNAVICSVLLNLMMRMIQQQSALPATSQQLYLSASFLNFVLSIFNNDSKDIQSLILKLWLQIGDHFPSELKTKCIDKAISVIYDSNHMLRAECLNLIGALNHVAISQESLLSLVAQFSSDTDPRVRRASIQSLLSLLERGAQVGLHIYQKSCDLLQDDDDIVRKNALQLIFCLGIKLQASNIKIPLAQDPSVLLSIEDDTFIRTCDMATDQSIAVRSLATTLLGQFKGVSEKFLLQTLHKKLMSHLKVVKSEHERAREVAGGSSRDWDSGQRWGGSSGAPKLDLDPTEVTLVRSGSCGAFVHSLEDEFLEVRSTAIISMGELGLINPAFGSESLDYLVDMFNDEIESIRLLAINCLRKVSATIHFREDQLETVLGVLQESSQEIREALHDLLATCHITTTSGLRMTVDSLLDNLKKYSIDCQSIWSCMKSLGIKHTHLVCSLVPELLSSHPYFLTKEPDINDPAYVSILILVFNATGSSPTMISLFPSHVFNHYTYLHDTLPLLIPSVKVLTASVTCQLPTLTSSSPEVFLKQILLQVDKPAHESHDSNVAMVTLKQCIKDLNQFSKVEPSLSGCVLFSSQLLQCRLLLMKVQKAISCAVMVGGSPNDIAADIRELFLLSYRLEWAYIDHEPQMLVTLKLLRVVAHCALVAFTIKLDWPSDHREKFEQLRTSLSTRIEAMMKFCCDSKLCEPVILKSLSSRLNHGESDQLLSLLQSTIHSFLHQNTRLDSMNLIKVKQCWADITHPNPADDVTHKFLSSLALALPFRAIVDNIPENSSLAVKIKLPDGTYIVSVPKDTEIRPSIETNGHTHKLNMKLILSHGNWTDSSSLLIQLVRYYNPDIPTDDKCLEVLNELSRKGGVARVSAVDCANDGIGEVVISNSIKVKTHPQEMLVKAFNVFGPI